nr:hypothetical protein [Tanacetum cinerariifolium]
MRAVEERQDGAFTSGSGKVQVNVIDSKFNEAQCAPTTIIANESNILPSSCLSIVKQIRRVMERIKSPAQDLHVVKAYVKPYVPPIPFPERKTIDDDEC